VSERPVIECRHANETCLLVQAGRLEVVAAQPNPFGASSRRFVHKRCQQRSPVSLTSVSFMDPQLLELADASPRISKRGADDAPGRIAEHESK